jgi:GDP-L-galactose phosphorylase
MAVCVATHTPSALPDKDSGLDRPISESPGSYFPQVSINVAKALSQRRIRSFGDLQLLAGSDNSTNWSSSSSDDESPEVISLPAGDFGGISGSLVDTLLISEWEERAEQGLFRYDVTACPTKVVPGAYGFIAQLNEGRASKKRPTEFTADKVCQDFDPKRFNFTKVPQKEILFQLDETAHAASMEQSAALGDSPNLVLINVSPIEYGHVLLVPRVMDCLPQVVDTRSLSLALHFCQEAQNPYFRLCYNSLGAYATVNHLHFQAYYLAAPFAVERAPTTALPNAVRRKDVEVAQLAEYPVRGLVFEAGETLTAMAELVGAACKRLQEANIPHNILVVDCGQRLFLFPNNFSLAKAAGEVPEDILETQVDPAAFEIAGHLITKRSQDYERISQAAVWRLLSYACFPDDAFDAFVELALRTD